ncbi:MAG TPA: phosphoribosylglycinamide formyltransferase [Chitinophagaceae bacterium]|nr:phosphoribosylglycinamide formyltransferase [Chitinophagaceae bacterium]
MTNPDKHAEGKKHIVVFASGTGSNAQKIIDHFTRKIGTGSLHKRRGEKGAKVVLIVSNNPKAGVLQIAGNENIPSLVIERKKFYEDGYLDELNKYKPDLIVLAGFMWKVPELLIRAFPGKIINIHPALLPKFGGKNMYGNFVHEAVLQAGEKESGITIHYADEIYDHGKIIFQAKCKVDEEDTPETLAQKIHALEHEHYPIIIEKLTSSSSVSPGENN